MAKKIVLGAGIELDGEKQFKNAISGINSDCRVLASEMQKVTAQFKQNSNSVESLTTKDKVLNDQIDKQKEKVNLLSQALDNSKKEFGENDTRTDSWQMSLNKAEAELFKLNDELEENKKALNEADDATKKNEKSLNEFEEGAEDAGKSALNFGDIIKANLISDAVISGLRGIGNAMVNVAKQFGTFVASGVQMASDLEESQNVVDVTFGNSANVIVDWSKKAAGAYGMSQLSAMTFTGTMGAMLKSMQLTDDVVLTMSQDMVGLAGDMASFYNIDVEEAFTKIRSGISGETEPLKQLGINMSVANLEAYALSEGLTATYNSMSQSEQAMLRYNYLMTVTSDAQGDFANTSDNFANQQRIAQLNVENLSTSIGSLLLPICNEAMQIFNGIFDGSMDLSEGLGKLSEMVIQLAEELIANLPEIIKIGTEIVTSLFEGIMSNLPLIMESALNLLQTLFNGLSENMPMLTEMAINIVMTLVEALITNLPLVLQMGLDIIIGIANGIAESLPTLIPTMIEVMMELVEVLTDNIDLLIDASIQIIMGLTDGIIAALPLLLEKAPDIIIKLVSKLIEQAPKLIEAGIDLLLKLVEGILKALPQLLESSIAIIPTILDAISTNANKMEESGKSIMDKLKVAISNGIKGLPGLGRELVTGLWNGINDMTSWIVSKIGGFTNKVLKSIKGFFGIKSPSTVMRDEVGKYLAEGVGVGFVDEMGGVTKDMENAIPKSFSTSISATGNSQGQLGQNIAQAANNIIEIPLIIGGEELARAVYRGQLSMDRRYRVVAEV